MEAFYHGFCNKRYGPCFIISRLRRLRKESWESYKEVNEYFCDAIMEVLRPNDILWIHDYHLMLLPSMIRRKMPEASIGFFLHIPFPSYELFRLLHKKWASGILEGLLGADLIGSYSRLHSIFFEIGAAHIGN